MLKDIAEVVAAFVLAWLFYQGLGFAAGTPMPIVSVVSESMEPVLHKGDLLFVVSDKEPKINDIVIYKRLDTGMIIVHRIVGLENEDYIIKGDNNKFPDSPNVKKEQILGKVVFAVPLLGYPRLILGIIGI